MQLIPAKRFIQQWDKTNNPAVKRGMVNDNPTLCHHIFEIAQAERVRQVPADTLGYYISGIMQAFEGFLGQGHGQATLQKNSMLPDHSLMRQNRSGRPDGNLIIFKYFQ